MEKILVEIIKNAFSNPQIKIFIDSSGLQKEFLAMHSSSSVFLLMSSGNFDGINLEDLADKLIGQMDDEQSRKLSGIR